GRPRTRRQDVRWSPSPSAVAGPREFHSHGGNRRVRQTLPTTDGCAGTTSIPGARGGELLAKSIQLLCEFRGARGRHSVLSQQVGQDREGGTGRHCFATSLVWGHTEFRVNLKRGMTQRHSRTETPSLVENTRRLHGLMTDGMDKDAETLVDLGSLA